MNVQHFLQRPRIKRSGTQLQKRRPRGTQQPGVDDSRHGSIDEWEEFAALGGALFVAVVVAVAVVGVSPFRFPIFPRLLRLRLRRSDKDRCVTRFDRVYGIGAALALRHQRRVFVDHERGSLQVLGGPTRRQLQQYQRLGGARSSGSGSGRGRRRSTSSSSTPRRSVYPIGARQGQQGSRSGVASSPNIHGQSDRVCEFPFDFPSQGEAEDNLPSCGRTHTWLVSPWWQTKALFSLLC